MTKLDDSTPSFFFAAVRHPELKIPPAAGMWAATRFRPDLAFRAVPLGVAAGVLFLTGVSFRWAETTVDRTRAGSSSRMIASGVYCVTGNPMYVGFLFLLVSRGTYLAYSFAFPVLFVGDLNRFQVAPEERPLAVHSATLSNDIVARRFVGF